MAPKGASLLPQDFAAGGALPDGEYIIAGAAAATFNYGGKGPDTPAIHITYVNADGEPVEQYYSAGKMDFLSPSDDGKRFVNPSGEEARIQKNSNAAAFLGSIIKGGFPVEKLTDDVSVFAGSRVLIRNEAQPKRPGIKDEKEGKTIPLVERYLGEAKGGSAKGATAGHATATPQTAASSASTNGQLDEAAVTAVQEALAEANGSLTRLKLGTAIMLKLSKQKDPNMAAIKKLATDAAWLAAQAEAGGWTSDGNTVALG